MMDNKTPLKIIFQYILIYIIVANIINGLK